MIEEVKSYKVGNCGFKTREDAENYLKRREMETETLFHNNKEIQNDKRSPLVTAIDEDGELYLIDKNELECLFNGAVRYWSKKVETVLYSEFLKLLVKKEVSIPARSYDKLMNSIIEMNDLAGFDGVDWRKLFLFAANLEIQPEYYLS